MGLAERHTDSAACPPTRPRRPDAEIEIFAILLGCGGERSEPAGVAEKTTTHLFEGSQDLSKVVKKKAQRSVPPSSSGAE